MTQALETVVDLHRYPLNSPDTQAYSSLVKQKQSDWISNGSFSLPGLIREEALLQCVAEINDQFDREGFIHQQNHNIYFLNKSETSDVPEDLTDKRFTTSSVTLTCDQLQGTLIRSIYEWESLCTFIQTVLDIPNLYLMADPMARLNVMRYAHGDQLGWHFDRAQFAVTLMLQSATSGGEFRFKRNLRSKSEPNFADVRELVNGDEAGVQVSKTKPGDLTVFAGYGSAHQVTPVNGDRPRIMAVFSYMTEPDVHYSAQDQVRFYGRSVA